MIRFLAIATLVSAVAIPVLTATEAGAEPTAIKDNRAKRAKHHPRKNTSCKLNADGYAIDLSCRAATERLALAIHPRDPVLRACGVCALGATDACLDCAEGLIKDEDVCLVVRPLPEYGKPVAVCK